MSPIWHHGGYLLECYNFFMGEKYVNACTEAVEEVIVEHYEDQIKFLEKEGIERSMLKKIKNFKLMKTLIRNLLLHLIMKTMRLTLDFLKP